MIRLIFLGAPGAGKGTQAVTLASTQNVVHISTGDILRQAVADASVLGVQAKAYIDSGDLVPDSLVIELIRERLQQSDAANGWILDGFPRNFSQAEVLEGLLTEIDQSCDGVVYFEVPTDVLVARMLARGRKDDNEVTVRRRLEVYEEKTVPLVAFYQQRGYLKVVDGSADIDVVADSLEKAIAA